VDVARAAVASVAGGRLHRERQVGAHQATCSLDQAVEGVRGQVGCGHPRVEALQEERFRRPQGAYPGEVALVEQRRADGLVAGGQVRHGSAGVEVVVQDVRPEVADEGVLLVGADEVEHAQPQPDRRPLRADQDRANIGTCARGRALRSRRRRRGRGLRSRGGWRVEARRRWRVGWLRSRGGWRVEARRRRRVRWLRCRRWRHGRGLRSRRRWRVGTQGRRRVRWLSCRRRRRVETASEPCLAMALCACSTVVRGWGVEARRRTGPGGSFDPPLPLHPQVRVQRPSRIQAQQQVLAAGGHLGDHHAAQIRGRDPRPAQVGGDQGPSGERLMQAPGGPQDGVSLGHVSSAGASREG